MKKPSIKLPALSFFYPAYNEAGNIEEALQQALAVLPTVAKKFEIIVINDGSKDGTKQIVERLAKKHRTIRIINQRNKGYGGALKRGFKAAKYEWIFFTDSDLQFDLNEIKEFITHTHEHQLILGYRRQRAEGWKRQILASALKIWNRVLLGFPRKIKDVDCAFKLIHKRVLTETQPLFSDGAMVSTELLLKAHRAKFSVTQVGVTHYQRRTGKPTGNSRKVILRAVTDTFRLQRALLTQSLRPSEASLAFSPKFFYTR